MRALFASWSCGVEPAINFDAEPIPDANGSRALSEVVAGNGSHGVGRDPRLEPAGSTDGSSDGQTQA